MLRKFIASFVLFFSLIINCHVWAEDNWQQKIPSELKPWIGWVSKDVKISECPFGYNDFAAKVCYWPTLLNVVLKGDALNFKMYVNLSGEDTFVPIIGEKLNAPSSVKVDGIDTPVIQRQNQPTIFLNKGVHVIEGEIKLDPGVFEITAPKGFALVKIKKHEEADFRTGVISNGKLQLLENSLELEKKLLIEQEKDSLEIKVFRKIYDALPTRIETYLELKVSGKDRDVNLGKIVFPHSTVYQYAAELPVKTNISGEYIFHLKAGVWRVKLDAVIPNVLSKLKFFFSSELFPKREVWVYDVDQKLRKTLVKGVKKIAPSQAGLPQEWKKDENCFLATLGETMDVVETSRAPLLKQQESFSLKKKAWLNFDGKGYIVNDKLEGVSLNRGFLESNPKENLSQVTVNSEKVPVVLLDGNNAQGIMSDFGKLEILSEGNVKDAPKLPIKSWNVPTQSISLNLHIPSGWSLFKASKESVGGSTSDWIGSWTRYSIFYTLLITVLVCKFWGFKEAFLALLSIVLLHGKVSILWLLFVFLVFDYAMTMTRNEDSLFRKMCQKNKLIITFWAAFICLYYVTVFILKQNFLDLRTREIDPNYIFIIVGAVIVSTLCKAISQKNKGKKVVSLFFGCCTLLVRFLIVICLILFLYSVFLFYQASVTEYSVPYNQERISLEKTYLEDRAVNRGVALLAHTARSEKAVPLELEYKNIPVGVGTPKWQGDTINFYWRNADNIPFDSELSLIYISPVMNLIISLLGMLVFILFLVRITFGVSVFNICKSLKSCTKTLTLLVLSFVFSSFEVQAEIPSAEILSELKQYVVSEQTKAPKCIPYCASLDNLKINIKGTKGILEFDINALEDVAVPVVKLENKMGVEFLLESVEINKEDKNLTAVKNNSGELVLLVKKGINKVVLKLDLLESRVVQLDFSQPFLNFNTNLSGWRLVDNVSNFNQLFVFDRLDTSISSRVNEGKAFGTDIQLSPYFYVNRDIQLGRESFSKITVRRYGNFSQGAVVELPLMPEENVISSGYNVIKNRVIVTFKPNETQKVLTTSFKLKNVLEFSTDASRLVFEKWKISDDKNILVKYEGTPRIISEEDFAQVWQPRPGEKLKLDITELKSVASSTKSIVGSELKYVVGETERLATLVLVVRSSVTSRHDLALPKNIEIDSVLLDGTMQRFDFKDGVLSLDLKAREQTIKIKWKEKIAPTVFIEAPLVDLGMPSINSVVEIVLDDRFVLFADGKGKGSLTVLPIILLGLIVLALVLAKFKAIPIKFYQWTLLLLTVSFISLPAALFIAVWFLYGFVFMKKLVNVSKRFAVSICLLTAISFWYGVILILQGVLFKTLHNIGLLGVRKGMFGILEFSWYQDIIGNFIQQPYVISLGSNYNSFIVFVLAFWFVLFSLSIFRQHVEGVKVILSAEKEEAKEEKKD